MNSALKPVLTTSPSQNSSATPPLNKPMHPQAPTTYGQPSTHVSPSLVNLPHNNPNFAHSHSHPNPAHQSNHFSLNVPSAPQHYASNTSNIPASNHPVVNASQASAGGQTCSLNKNAPYSGGYQPNLGHPPNQNPLPPVSQSLVATHPAQPAPVPAEVPSSADKPQSNGTPETKSPNNKSETLENHTQFVSKDKQSSEKPLELAEEKSAPPVLPTHNQSSKPDVEEAANTTAASPAAPNNETPPAAVNLSPTADAASSGDSPENTENVSPSIKKSNTVKGDGEDAQNHTPPKTTKEKEQKSSSSSAKSATPRTPTRKSKTPKLDSDSPKTSKSDNKTTPVQKLPSVATKAKRNRVKTQPYQSPLPEIEIITKISSLPPKSKSNDDKLIVFYKNEFLAVRNSEGSFYICQAVQNIYKSSPKIRIRWLSQDKSDKSGEVYTPDFYDYTDFDCILTNLNLVRINKGTYRLPPAEKERTDSILKRSLAVEKGEVTSPSLTEEHPDGIDVSLYKEESQLKKKRAAKRKASSPLRSPRKSNKSKSPDQPKAAKLSTKSAKSAKRGSFSQTTSTADARKAAASSRTDRAKRRSDVQNHATKVAPVVDQKKARVLAKVARKAAGASTRTNSSSVKSTKASKSISSKVQKPPPKAAAKKTKRSSRK